MRDELSGTRKARVNIQGCAFKGICCKRVVRAIGDADGSPVLAHDLPEAIVTSVWERARAWCRFRMPP